MEKVSVVYFDNFKMIFNQDSFQEKFRLYQLRYKEKNIVVGFTAFTIQIVLIMTAR